MDHNLGTIKLKVPSFEGRSDPDAYLTWEKRVENIFACYNYSEQKKVRLAVAEFVDYALIWWDQLGQHRLHKRDEPVSTWAEMKRILRDRFVPSHYFRDLYNKLHNIVQGNRTIDEYYKEMEIAIIRANVVENRESTMARFLV